MARISKNLGFTVSPAMADKFEQVAKREQSTKSELFRRMFRLYLSYVEPIQERSDTPDAWAERLILEAQEQDRQNPISGQAFLAEIEQAQRYGAKRSKALGITSEEALNAILYEERPPVANRA